MTDRFPRRAAAALVASGLVVAGAALVTHLWRVVPWPRFGFAVALAAVSFAVAWLVRRGLRWSMASGLALTWFLALGWFVGPSALLAVALLAAAALCIGTMLVPDVAGRIAIAVPVGLLAIAGTTGWIVTLPLHYRASWGVVLGMVILLRRRVLLACLRELQAGWQNAVAVAPAWAAFAVMSLGVTSAACWLPTMQVDDLAYHLGLPSQLLALHRYAPDPAHQVWSVAAWAGDVLHGIAMVLANGPVRGAVNALWLCSGAMAMWTAVGRLSTAPVERWVGVALFAGFPPLAWLAAGMQTELPATAALLALAAVLLPTAARNERGDAPARPLVVPGAVLMGGLLALKPMHALVSLPLLAYAAWRARGRWPWRELPLALAIVLIIGGASYWYAWHATGNPVLPLFNATFRSPYFPLHDFDDARWHAGFDAALWWQLVIDTHRYGEGWDGGLGISLLALAGAWVLAVGRAETRAFALAAGLVVFLPLVPLQYARYAVPGMVLWMMAALPGAERTLGRRVFDHALGAVCAVNLLFQANAGWTQHSATLNKLVGTGGDASAVLAKYAPERMLLRHVPASDVVLAADPGRGFVAELAGRGRTVSWHDPTLAEARVLAEADDSGARWRAMFDSTRARWILLVPATASPALREALADDGAVRSAAAGDAELWRLRNAAAP